MKGRVSRCMKPCLAPVLKNSSLASSVSYTLFPQELLETFSVTLSPSAFISLFFFFFLVFSLVYKYLESREHILCKYFQPSCSLNELPSIWVQLPTHHRDILHPTGMRDMSKCNIKYDECYQK